MKNIHFIILLFLALKMCYCDEIEELVKKYQGQPLNEINIDFTEENCRKLSMLSGKFYLSENANLLWAYVRLNTKSETYTILKKFYDIAAKKQKSNNYKKQWEIIYKNAWDDCNNTYEFDEKTIKTINEDLDDLENYGIYPFTDPYTDDFDPDHIAKIEQQLKLKADSVVKNSFDSGNEEEIDIRKRSSSELESSSDEENIPQLKIPIN